MTASNPIHPKVLVPQDFDFLRVVESTSETDARKTAYRLYDEAVIRWLTRKLVIGGKTIPVIPTAPQNAFANYESLLVRLGYQALCPLNKQDYSAYPLPMVNVNRVAEEVRAGSNYGYPIRNIALLRNRRKSVFTRYPKPMYFSYSIGLWSLTRSDMEWMKQKIELSFWDKIATTTVHLPFEVLGKKLQMASIRRDSGEVMTESSRDDKSEMLHRFVFKVSVEAWMWDELLEAPTILALEKDLRDSDENQLGLVRNELAPDLQGPASSVPPD